MVRLADVAAKVIAVLVVAIIIGGLTGIAIHVLTWAARQ